IDYRHHSPRNHRPHYLHFAKWIKRKVKPSNWSNAPTEELPCVRSRNFCSTTSYCAKLNGHNLDARVASQPWLVPGLADIAWLRARVSLLPEQITPSSVVLLQSSFHRPCLRHLPAQPLCIPFVASPSDKS